tara:strand:+ start:432 stop:1034 length:603 start_codon:yes stop_codon:yes gene_type:complete
VKKTITLFFLITSFVYGQKDERSKLLIPPKQIIRIDYPLFKDFKVKIWNKSRLDIHISSRSRKTDSLNSSLILEKNSISIFEVNQGMYLQLENKYLSILRLEFTLLKSNSLARNIKKNLTPQRAFYLENNTSQTIPLKIPGVMSPNLAPYSRSGVDLLNGQEVYIDLKGKDILILTVTKDIPHGARIDVADLINKALNQY